MDNLTSRDEEKSLEQAREKGRKDEYDRQKERDQATEKGRKQGLDEGRAREKRQGRSGSGLMIVLLLFVIVIIGIGAAFLTLTVSVTNVAPGNSLPFTTMYGVSFPEGQTITIGNTHINVLSYQNELISDIDGDRQKLEVGAERVITERRAVITTLSIVTLMDTNFKIDLNYKGDRDNRAYFDMGVHTSEQVPDMLIKLLLPPEIDARPI
ncbi:MAG: hypothetical protein V1862_05325 [Methanobacteriota archaeon]